MKLYKNDEVIELDVPARLIDGRHGYGLTPKSNKMELHISQWAGLLIKWFDYIEWYN